MDEKNGILFLEPLFSGGIWGDGSILKRYPSCAIGRKLAADTAVIGSFSVHPKASNTVVNGTYAGKNLFDVFTQQPELFGPLKPTWDYPSIGIGVGHACADLSIQVHPQEQYALSHENAHGKSECWYIVDVDDEPADVVLGHIAKTREEFKALADAEKFDELLLRKPVKKGSFFNLLAGTVHALQKGTTFIEVCSNSNITYRLFDYHRKDKTGNPRRLDEERFYQNVLIPYEEMTYSTVRNTYQGVNESVLTDNDNFCVRLFECQGKGTVPRLKPYYACFVVEGEGQIDSYDISAGSIFVITSAAREFTLTGSMKILASHG